MQKEKDRNFEWPEIFMVGLTHILFFTRSAYEDFIRVLYKVHKKLDLDFSLEIIL